MTTETQRAFPEPTCSGLSGHYDNRKSGYRESWQDGLVKTRIQSSLILPGYPVWRKAWGVLPDVPNE